LVWLDLALWELEAFDANLGTGSTAANIGADDNNNDDETIIKTPWRCHLQQRL
jgi:hypothetical protein